METLDRTRIGWCLQTKPYNINKKSKQRELVLLYINLPWRRSRIDLAVHFFILIITANTLTKMVHGNLDFLMLPNSPKCHHRARARKMVCQTVTRVVTILQENLAFLALTMMKTRRTGMYWLSSVAKICARGLSLGYTRFVYTFLVQPPSPISTRPALGQSTGT